MAKALLPAARAAWSGEGGGDGDGCAIAASRGSKRGTSNTSSGFIETSIPARFREKDLRRQVRDCLCPAEVSALAGVHANFLAFVDEGRHLHNQACLELGRLGHARGSGRLQARFGLHHFKLDSRRQLYAHSSAVMV